MHPRTYVPLRDTEFDRFPDTQTKKSRDNEKPALKNAASPTNHQQPRDDKTNKAPRPQHQHHKHTCAHHYGRCRMTASCLSSKRANPTRGFMYLSETASPRQKHPAFFHRHRTGWVPLNTSLAHTQTPDTKTALSDKSHPLGHAYHIHTARCIHKTRESERKRKRTHSTPNSKQKK